jgi:hypothetical protein
LVYVGIAGRKTQRALAWRVRLLSHASGRRSGDQFCVYVADHYVLPELTRPQIEGIRDSQISMDGLVRAWVRPAKPPQHDRERRDIIVRSTEIWASKRPACGPFV